MAPTIEEVYKAAKKHSSVFCEDCPIEKECEKGSSFQDCREMFLASVIAGKINLDGTPVKVEGRSTKTLTLEEVYDAVQKHYEKGCPNCHAKKECKEDECLNRFVGCTEKFLVLVIARKINLDGTPVSVEPEPAKPTLPKWVEAGRWVFFCGTIYKISAVDEDGFVHLYRKVNTPAGFGTSLVKHLRPVRFRLYDYQEAKGLLGKVIEGENGSCRFAHLVDHVTEHCDGVLINGNRAPVWNAMGATIDGVPFGIPEVDTEAEQEG